MLNVECSSDGFPKSVTICDIIFIIKIFSSAMMEYRKKPQLLVLPRFASISEIINMRFLVLI